MKLISLIALALLLSSCAKKAEEPKGDPAAPVQTSKAAITPIDRTVTADAVIFPASQAAITPKLTAPVKRVLVNRGDHVKAGQLLAELEDRDLVSAAAEARALYEQAQSQFRATTAGTMPEDLTRARSDADTARQTLEAAKKVYENRVALVREGALAQKLADDAKVAQVQAQGQADTAQRHLESLQNVNRAEQVKTAQSTVDAARARLTSAEAQIAYTRIQSPINGIVSDRPTAAGETASAGVALITIVDISEVVARINIPASEAQLLSKGVPATITSGDIELQGKVNVISPSADPASTTLEVWVRAPNPGERMKPGASAKVTIHAATIKDALVIPATALVSSDEGETQVLVVADGVAHERKVQTGARDGANIQITDGLKPGEEVIVSGGVGLADKAAVKVESAPAKESAPEK